MRLTSRTLRASARLRLTIGFTLGVLGVGIAVVAAVLVVMRFVPDYQLEGTPASGPDGGGDTPLLATTSNEGPTISSAADVLQVLLGTSVAVVAGTGVLGALASWVLAGRLLRPLRTLADSAAGAELGTGRRVAVDGRQDEFGRLARSFNEMLDRLDQTFAAQRRFAANASHELRTPLTTTKAMLDVAADDAEAVDVPALLARLRATTARSLASVEALLLLADAESGALGSAEVDLVLVARSSLDALRDEVDRRHIRVSVRSAPSVVVGDAALLTTIVDNLLRNAVRHNVDGGWIAVTIERDRLCVENTGPVLEAETIDRLTEPFFRGAGRVAGSHGLGLALVAAAVSAHGGDLVLAGLAGGGLRAQVRLPAAGSAHDAYPRTNDEQGRTPS